MFRRREKESLLRRGISFLWPRSGFRRAGRYIGYRIVRLPGTPYAIGGGIACGVAVSFTPFIGLHILLGAAFAWTIRCSIVASIIGTIFGNPWTFPFIWAWIYKTGSWILGRPVDPTDTPLQRLTAFFDGVWTSVAEGVYGFFGLSDLANTEPGTEGGMTAQKLWDVGDAVILPMMVGALPNMLVAWITAYLPVYFLVASYQGSRRRRQQSRDMRAAQVAESQ